jgi:hypothetical protein
MAINMLLTDFRCAVDFTHAWREVNHPPRTVLFAPGTRLRWTTPSEADDARFQGELHPLGHATCLTSPLHGATPSVN